MTQDGTRSDETAGGRALPGLLLVLHDGAPSATCIPLSGGAVELGRGVSGLDDARLSRRHTRITASSAGWSVEDLGSKNGTWADGARVGDVRAAAPVVASVRRCSSRWTTPAPSRAWAPEATPR